MTAPINARVANLIRRANAAASSGEFIKALRLARESVKKAENTFHRATQTAAHYTLATILWADENASPKEARKHAARALELAEIHSDEYYLAMTLLARIDAGLGNFEYAQALNENLLEIYQRKERHQGIADVLRSLGDLAMKQNDLSTARMYFEKSLKLYSSTVDDPLNHAGLLLSMGSLAYREGNFDTAKQYWEQAHRIGMHHQYYGVIESAQMGLNLLADLPADE